MSWHYLPERVAAFSVRSCSVSQQSVTLSSIPSVSRSLRPGSGMDTSRTRPSGTTSRPLTENPGLDRWISLLRASRASRSLRPGGEGLSEIPAICGLRPFASLGRSGPRGCYWRTSPDCSTNPTDTLERYSETWPRAGIMLDGDAYRLRPLVPPTFGIGCGLLGTPSASMGYLYLGCLRAKETWETSAYLNAHLLGMELGLKGRSKYRGPKMCCHPDFAEWMMGWPIGWSALEPLETARFRRWWREFGGF